MTEAFLNRLVATPRHEAGPVADCILGAQVSGEQNTQASLSLHMVPSSQQAKIELQLTGVTCSRTTARTPQAAVESSGQQLFDVRKPVDFDGSKFITRSPGTTLDPRQMIHQAHTNATQIPVIGSIADTIAFNQANRRTPLARQEVAQKVTQRVSPPFNANIDERLGAMNEALATGSSAFPKLFEYFATAHWTSSQSEAIGVLNGMEPIGSSPPLQRGGASLRAHESVVASIATATQLAGREVTIAEIRRWIGAFDRDLGTSADKRMPLLQEAATDTSLILAPDRPLTAQFENQQLRIILRASLRAAGGVDLPVHRIDIGYRVQRTGQQITLTPLPVNVASEAGEGMVTNAIEQAIRTQIESRLTPITISPEAIPPTRNGARAVISDITAENGWLTVTID